MRRFPAGEDGAALTPLDLGRLVNELKAISRRWMNCRRICLAGAQSGPELCERWQAPALTEQSKKSPSAGLQQQREPPGLVGLPGATRRKVRWEGCKPTVGCSHGRFPHPSACPPRLAFPAVDQTSSSRSIPLPPRFLLQLSVPLSWGFSFSTCSSWLKDAAEPSSVPVTAPGRRSRCGFWPPGSPALCRQEARACPWWGCCPEPGGCGGSWEACDSFVTRGRVGCCLPSSLLPYTSSFFSSSSSLLLIAERLLMQLKQDVSAASTLTSTLLALLCLLGRGGG